MLDYVFGHHITACRGAVKSTMIKYEVGESRLRSRPVALEQAYSVTVLLGAGSWIWGSEHEISADLSSLPED